MIPEQIPVNYVENIYFKSNIAKDDFLNYFKDFILSKINKNNIFIFPNISSQGLPKFEYINVNRGRGVEEFIEALNSISEVKPNLFC
ncbi:MAG: hypothetical protein KME52_23830 [Desmonostoc geniculatum HA4340-LM1]|nr:hypothetical protein [Desmonostoc geniculatum HA4340-LM1]